ncbi:MAG: adenine phosphoribosyltransferase [Gemmatimonadaceae bacterium]
MAAAVRDRVRDVADFPRSGIVFKDITPVLADAELFAAATAAMAAPFVAEGVTHVVAVESRGFIFGGPVAQRLGAGFVPVRKRGKLPSRTESVEYSLEYGVDVLEMHADAFEPGARALIVDDVLATGGTAAATCRLVERLGGVVVGCTFLIALSFLGGDRALTGRRLATLVTY